MFATDFLFDGQHASDLGLMICSFDGGIETASGGEIEYNVVKTPARDNFIFYGSQFNSVITWNFSICKNPCKNDNMYFDQYEESMIVKWLVKTDGYRWIQFVQEGYEDIFYRVYINAQPHQIAGRTAGFDLTVTSDCAYGFTDVIVKKATISDDTPLILNIHSDIDTYILPVMKIKFKSDNVNPLLFCNYRDIENKDAIIDKPVRLENMTQDVVLDSGTDVIEGLTNPDDFNWNFMKLVDGMNVITIDHGRNIEIELQYREPRYVRV